MVPSPPKLNAADQTRQSQGREMSIESLTIHEGYLLAGLVEDLRRIAENTDQSKSVRAIARTRADALDRWIDAVGETLQFRARSMEAEDRPRTSSPAPSRAEREWIPVTSALAEPGQFAFKFTDGPLAGLPLSISVHGREAILWLARNGSGEMFVRPWLPDGEGDVPCGALVIGSYRPALLAGARGGYEWLPIVSAN
jgi:hypothetical protein